MLVTLPKEFTDFHELGPRSELDIELGDDSDGRFLKITPKEEKDDGTKEIQDNG